MNWPEITKDTPLEEIKRIHQDIWQYVVDHAIKPTTPYYSNCVACEYVKIHNADLFAKNECYSCCPIAWPKKVKNSYGVCSQIFYDWIGSRTIGYNYVDTNGEIRVRMHQNKELAKQIRDMPFKFEKEEH